MSSFIYGEHSKNRIGVWLRPRSNEDIINLIKKSKLKRYKETIQRIVVSEYIKKGNEVFLEIWCKSVLDVALARERYNVFYIKTKINPKWVCEGDLGTGFKE